MGAALVGLLLWGGLWLGVRDQARRQQVEVADALAVALSRLPGSLNERLTRLPALARAASADVRLSDHDDLLLAEATHPKGLVGSVAASGAASPAASHAHPLQVPAATQGLLVDGQALVLTVRLPNDGLWRLFQLATLMLWAGAGVALAASLIGARQRRRQLLSAVAATLAQARSLGEAGYVMPRIVALPELRPVVQAMDQLHQRMRALFEVHAEQLETLRRQAHNDALTGLPNRRHFLAVLDAVLGGEGAPPEAGLVLVRLVDLQGLNQRMGNAATDRLLQAFAQLLGSYPLRTDRCAVGRLSGGEFGLLLPAGGIARETALSLLQALSAQLVRVNPDAKVLVGAVELRPPMAAAQAMLMAQAALATAVSAETTASARSAQTEAQAHEPGGAWQLLLARALVQGHVKLGEYPMHTRHGQTLLWDCPLRVQLKPGGAFEPASRWLAQATRNKLNTAVDEKAVMLALAGIAQDGMARCVNIAAASAMSAEFVSALARRLSAAPELANQLWLDLPESLALEQPELVRHLSRRCRPLGARVALEHCGEGLLRVPRLIDLGLDAVRIDGRFVNGIAEPRADDARQYLQGLVRLVQSVGLYITAEGVRSTEDLAQLWLMGFDAATGPAVQRHTTAA